MSRLGAWANTSNWLLDWPSASNLPRPRGQTTASQLLANNMLEVRGQHAHSEIMCIIIPGSLFVRPWNVASRNIWNAVCDKSIPPYGRL